MAETENDIVNEDTENTSKRLFKHCMKGEWREVMETYRKEKKAHTTRITRTGDTAMHVAVIDGQYHVVNELVKLIRRSEEGHRKKALSIQNERKNTILHLAASMESVKMCECIASAEASLLGMRNVDGETPLFLAALHGKKEVFLSLHNLSNTDRKAHDYYSNCRRTDGDTILHSAIAGDYLGLVNSKNEIGLTPLHLLANKPSVFKSGCHLGRFEAIVYHELKVTPWHELQGPTTDKEKNSYPENYETCMELLRVTQKFISIVTHPLTQFLRKRLRRNVGTERDLEESKSPGSETSYWSHHPLYPDNYKSCADLFKFVFMIMSIIFGTGSANIKKIRRMKEKNLWSAQIMDELLKRTIMYEYDDDGSKPIHKLENKHEQTQPYSVDEGGNVTMASIVEEHKNLITKGEPKQQKNGGEKDEKTNKRERVCETPILIAAKNGVTELVEKIMEAFPVAIHDIDANKKNIVLLAVENRHTCLYNLLLKKKHLKETIFGRVDKEGNSALHLAAKLGDYNKPWFIPGEALQMNWEIKWYLFVKESMSPHFFSRYNNENKTPTDIFSETHGDLVKSGGEWLKKTSESCSLVAALIATTTVPGDFSTATTVPGDFKNETGTPTLENRPEFKAFAISSLIALCCSVTSLVLFLSILTSRYQESDFGRHLPRKLILGLTSLFMSITSMMVCFSTAHFFILKDKKSVTFPLYAVTCLPVTLFGLAQFPLYIDLIWATFKKFPQRAYKKTLQ
ncbi:unnamed protein product [Sphenostylis stenocarpa]|uniref:PGG domain-containing protein n=1 Tax=Sphenostylis stenocarpa TaxID=92480 RepID=A0AA86VZ89_9FABA|nr:unnamed protein product [Sphenostylis stenocarpa]